MLNTLATRLARRLLLKNVIIEDHFDVYVYGFELLISSISSTVLIFLIGLLTHNILQTIAFLVTFILLRQFSGGYHANTYGVCFVVTLSVFGLVLLLANHIQIHLTAFWVLSVIGTFLLIGVAPIENPNKKIIPEQRNKFKLISVVLFILLILIAITLRDFAPRVSSTVFFVLMADLILLFIKTKRKEKTNESN